MKSPLYTPEAKRAQSQPQISDDAGKTVAVVYTDHADADRIVECVNACEGIADPVAFIAAARKALEFYADLSALFETMTRGFPLS